MMQKILQRFRFWKLNRKLRHLETLMTSDLTKWEVNNIPAVFRQAISNNKWRKELDLSPELKQQCKLLADQLRVKGVSVSFSALPEYVVFRKKGRRLPLIHYLNVRRQDKITSQELVALREYTESVAWSAV